VLVQSLGIFSSRTLTYFFAHALGERPRARAATLGGLRASEALITFIRRLHPDAHRALAYRWRSRVVVVNPVTIITIASALLRLRGCRTARHCRPERGRCDRLPAGRLPLPSYRRAGTGLGRFASASTGLICCSVTTRS
jgi:hypothetical protein